MENYMEAKGCLLKNTLMEIIITTLFPTGLRLILFACWVSKKTTPELVLWHADPLLVNKHKISSHTTASAR
jgi:hypothetical protein